MEFEDFVSAEAQRLLRFAYVLTEDGPTAEDLTQNALTAIYRRWRSIDHPYAYARRTILHAAIDRTRRRDPIALTPHALVATLDELQIVSSVEDSFDIESMRQHLRRLPPRQRAVLVLRYYEDLTDEEIAETMRITPSTVRSTATRALATLRRTLPIATQGDE